jgi:hypothetical protein
MAHVVPHLPNSEIIGLVFDTLSSAPQIGYPEPQPGAFVPMESERGAILLF